MKQRLLTNEEIGMTAQALGHLIHAGIGSADAWMLLRQDETDPALGALWQRMADLADNGASLAETFRAAGCFPGYVCALLDVGELVGRTEETLASLGSYYQSRARLEKNLRTALTYPALLMGVLMVVMAVMVLWVLPVFDDVYARLGSRLTGLAGGLLSAGQFIKQSLPVCMAVLMVLGCLLSIPAVRAKLLEFWKKRWGDRGVLGRIHAARFVQAVSLGISSGMAARDAVALASSLAEDPGFEKRCQDCAACVDAGETLSQALRSSGMLENARGRLLEAGERAGNSEQVLAEISAQLLEESEEALERQAGRAEPAMLAVACLLIGMVLLSVMLPLMNILSSIG